jgi:hypothetical protein
MNIEEIRFQSNHGRELNLEERNGFGEASSAAAHEALLATRCCGLE